MFLGLLKETKVTDLSILFQPIAIGSLTLKNRLAMAPMTRISAEENGCATEQMAANYARYAAGGFGLVICEANYVDQHYSQGYHFQPGLATTEQADSWRPVVDAVHANGAKVCMQFVHAGALNQGRRESYPQGAIAPSAFQPIGEMLPFYRGEGQYDAPREITADEIVAVKASFADAAKRAVAVGFDAIEIHGANGYLLDQFFTAYTNQRTDEYGGEVRNRIRLDEEITREVIAAIGGAVPVGVRLSQSKVNDYEYTWPGGEDDAAVVFPVLEAAGAAYIHITEHVAVADAFHSGTTLAGLAKKYLSIPVIVNGGLGEPELAASVIADGNGDIIALGKSALANHDWPNKVQAGGALDEFDFGMLSPIADLNNAEVWAANR